MYQPAHTLTVENARAVLEAGLRAIAEGQPGFDLAAVTVVDSAAVAILLAWQRAAQAGGKSIVFTNLPANLQSLVHLYDVGALLQIAPEAPHSLPRH
ncbi:MAG TPA: STAS domain-containing protein [Noviherbaspirillum sp.]|nr:STAS domain-containing protein [Noviherbaspirillum sp.]